MSLSVIEKVKGSEIPSHVVANNLSRDNTYVARMAALNAAGVGKYSSILQRKGQGIKPFFLSQNLFQNNHQYLYQLFVVLK